jgi:ubiquinone biosynthesis protein
VRLLTQLARLEFIHRVFLKYGLDDLLFSLPLTLPLKYLCWLSPHRWVNASTRSLPRAERLRRSLEELGPIFVKFGQMLSTRRDLLPDDIALELSRLQDKVPPFSSEESIATVEKALGQPVDECFASFDREPLASASIAQVHAAELISGEQVVVKVLRPNIEKTIARDLSLMYLIASITTRVWSGGRRLRPHEVVSEYEKTIYDELDLQREAANAAQLRKNFQDSDQLYIPEVYWDYTRDNILVLERISGIPVSDIDQIRNTGVDIKKLAERGVDIFFTQVFRDNFFHADMHPGNIFVSSDNTREPMYIAVDFGIVGSLTEEDRHYLSQNLLAFFDRDYRRVAKLHVDSGWVPPETRIEEFESAIRTVCEPIFEKPLEEISFGQVLLRLFQTARRFNMEVQPQLVLLQKTLLNIEGLGRQLYPQLDLWATARPSLKKWMSQQIGPHAVLEDFRKNAPEWARMLPHVPGLLYGFLQQQGGTSSVGSHRRARMQNSGLRAIVYAICAATLFIATVLIMLLSGDESRRVLGAPVVSWLLLLASGVCLSKAFSGLADKRR